MRVLIVEDEIKTAAFIAKGLRENQFAVDIAHQGVDGLHLATQHHYDLLIIDAMLPMIDGWTLVATIRKVQAEVRILMLTACGNVEDKIKGLDLGADDYLVKPFVFAELLARVRSLLRRKSNVPTTDIRIADLTIDPAKFKVTRGGERISLSPKEFQLLMYLAEHQTEVLSRTLIAECVWDINFDSDSNVVDVAVRRLRQKIDGPFEKKLIHTVHGVGYVLEER